MADFHLYKLTDEDFENLVVQICRDWLGEAASKFAPGRDGGRDSKFEGTANNFPSKVEPARGKFIVQAKASRSPVASASNGGFTTVVKKEFSKIKKLKADGEIDNYILFTNRKKPAGADKKIVDLIKDETGVGHVWLRGREEIESYLDVHAELVRSLGLDRLRSPLRIRPEELSRVIQAFDKHIDVMDKAFDSMMNFAGYKGITKKNKINELSDDYFKYITANSEPHFSDIKSFLENPRNEDWRRAYHNAADQFQSKVVVHRGKFGAFEEVFDEL